MGVTGACSTDRSTCGVVRVRSLESPGRDKGRIKVNGCGVRWCVLGGGGFGA